MRFSLSLILASLLQVLPGQINCPCWSSLKRRGKRWQTQPIRVLCCMFLRIQHAFVTQFWINQTGHEVFLWNVKGAEILLKFHLLIWAFRAAFRSSLASFTEGLRAWETRFICFHLSNPTQFRSVRTAEVYANVQVCASQKGMQMQVFVTFFTCPCEPSFDLRKRICLQNFAEFFQHLEDVQE